MDGASGSGRMASGAWLDRSLVTFAALLMVGGTIAGLGVLFVTANGTLDLFGRPLGTDFSSFWTAGRMAFDGRAAEAYVWKQHLAEQVRTHGTDAFFPWSYPPIFLLLAATFSTLPYVTALAAWQSASALAAALVFRRVLASRRALLIAAGFPAVLICLGHGQTGFLTAALLGAGVLALERHQVAAGVCFGLLAYKPQFGLLIPLALIAGGSWRAITAAVATIVVAVAATWALWGWPVWLAFFESLPLTRTVVFETGNTGWEKFQSVFAWMRMWGGSLALAYGAQALVSLVSAVGCVLVWRSDASRNLKGAALLSGVLLSSPYVLDYDLLAFGMALAFLTAHGLAAGFAPWEKTLIAWGWLMPVCARALAQIMLLPVGFLTLAGTFLWTVHRALAEQAERRPAALNGAAA